MIQSNFCFTDIFIYIESMKRLLTFVLGAILFSSAYGQNHQTSSLTDTLNFVPTYGFNIKSMPVNIPNSELILTQEFTVETMTGGILNIFLSDWRYNKIAPFTLRNFNPSSASEYNSYMKNNYFLIDKHTVIHDW